jgi:hypothetical protein
VVLVEAVQDLLLVVVMQQKILEVAVGAVKTLNSNMEEGEMVL